MYITILGRQPALGIAELEQVYGAESVRWFSDSSAIVENDAFDFERVAGSQKPAALSLNSAEIGEKSA